MQYLSRSLGNWQMLRRESTQPPLASGPSTAQIPVAQAYMAPQEQQIGGQTLEELLKLRQQQQQQQPQAMSLGQNYLRQFMPPASANYFQQLY